MDAKFARGDKIRVVKQYRGMLLPGEIHEIDSVSVYGDAEGFLYRFTRITTVQGSNPDRFNYGCLSEDTLVKHFEIVQPAQYLRGKLRDVQAMIQEYQVAERKILDQLAAVLCCFKTGEEVEDTKTHSRQVVTKVAFRDKTPQDETKSDNPCFLVELRFNDVGDIDVGNCDLGRTDHWATNVELLQMFTKIEK